MAEIRVNTEQIKESARLLQNAHYIMDIEADTLKQVADIVETAWISSDTATLVSCINIVRKKVLTTSKHIEDMQQNLNSITWRVKATEAINIASNIITGGNTNE